jgi:hypothetical protein
MYSKAGVQRAPVSAFPALITRFVGIVEPAFGPQIVMTDLALDQAPD